ncbi:hypothetical protein MPER_07268, partial [Moniliophthora perniciosa FA553]
DVSDEEQVKKMVEDVVKDYGSLDVMIANAGIARHRALIDTTSEDLDKVISVNFKGVFFCYKHAAIQMIAQNRPGRIIGASSVMGKQGAPGLSVYSSTKFAVRGLTQSAAKELGPHKVTVNAYAPGCIKTEMMEEYDSVHAQKTGGQAGDLMTTLAAMSCLGYNGSPSEVASLVSYLASDAAHFITGQTISVNAGFFFD